MNGGLFRIGKKDIFYHFPRLADEFDRRYRKIENIQPVYNGLNK